MSILSAFPSIRPTLSLDFAKVKALDPRITFTRASTATYYDAEGVLRTAASGEARFTHNPDTEESLGLLIEEARTNLIVHSGAVGDTTKSWGLNNCTADLNAVVAPDGTLSGTEITSTNGTTEVRPRQDGRTITAGTNIAFSCFVKVPPLSGLTDPAVRLFISTTVSGVNRFSQNEVTYNFTTNTFYSVGSDVLAYGADLVGNGWVRVWGVVNGAANTATSTNLYLNMSNGNTNRAPVGAKMFYWGTQLEAGSFPTSYIPTVASQVTRAADAASMTGVNFSSWYNAENAGSVYVEANETFAGNSSGPWWLHAGFSLRGIAYRRFVASNTLEFGYRQPDGAVRNTSISDSLLAGQNNKVAVSFDAANSSVCVNGASAATSSSSNLYPSVDQLRIGYAAIAGNSPYVWCGTIKKLAYYPARLPNGQLQALTA
jgi:hypothetical protein